MSSQASFVTIPTTQVGVLLPAGWNMLATGSKYRATPVAVGDGEAQGYLIDAFGRQIIIGPAADNSAFIENPVPVGGIYRAALPTYDNGDQTTFHLDVNGRLYSRVVGDAADHAAVSGNPVRVGGQYLAALPTYDAGDQVTDQHDASGRKYVTDDQLLAAFNAEDFATETTLNSLLTAFNAEDFATETTLNSLLTAFNAEDFATQTTLAALLAAFNAEDFASETTLNSLLTAFNAEDFSTETTLNSLLTAFNAEDFASETTLAALSAKFGSLGQKASAGSAPVVLSTEQEAIIQQIADNQQVDLDVVDFLDAGVLDASSTNIPASASVPVTVVASLAAAVKKIKVFDTTGFYIGLYSDPAGTPVLEAILGPGMDGDIEVDLPATTVLGLRHMQNSAITGGEVGINFMG